MAVTLADLQATFRSDVQWFNAHVFPAVPNPQYDRFDNNVAMKRIDDPSAYYQSKPTVAGYFSGTGNQDQARFDFDDSAPFGQPTFEIVGSLGFVSGTGSFVDKTVPAPGTAPRRIAYSFTYTGASGNWKAIHLWGMYID